MNQIVRVAKALPGLAVIVVLAGTTSRSQNLLAQACSTDADTRAVVERLVRQRTVAWFSADARTYGDLTAPEFVYDGLAAGEQRIPRFPVAHPFDIEDLRVVEYPDSAIVTYTLTEHLSHEDGAPFDRRRRTEMWIRSNGKWTAASVTSVPSTSSPDLRSPRY